GVIRATPPGEGDREIVAPAAPRALQSLQQRPVGAGLETAADGLQRGGILHRRPGKQRLRDRDPHGRNGSQGWSSNLHRERSPIPEEPGVKIVVFWALRSKVTKKPWESRPGWGKTISGPLGGPEE